MPRDFQGGNIRGALNVPSEHFYNDAQVDKLVARFAQSRYVVFHCMFSQQRVSVKDDDSRREMGALDMVRRNLGLTRCSLLAPRGALVPGTLLRIEICQPFGCSAAAPGTTSVHIGARILGMVEQRQSGPLRESGRKLTRTHAKCRTVFQFQGRTSGERPLDRTPDSLFGLWRENSAFAESM
eukprot:scaffold17_cov354-Pavlova_lutheri.AAC.34